MKRIWMYLSAYKKECVFAPLFKMLEALFELFVPLVVSAIIDTGIGNADKGYIVKISTLIRAIIHICPLRIYTSNAWLFELRSYQKHIFSLILNKCL